MTKSALILIDIQNDYFENGKWPVDKMHIVSQNAARLLVQARNSGDTVIHIQHEIPSDKAPFFQKGTKGAEIHVSVAPDNGEMIIKKSRPNSFHNTSLREALDHEGITKLTLCGAMTQMCIDATTRAAVDFGYSVTVVEDACGAKQMAFTDQTVSASLVHAAFMAALASSYARVVGCDTYLGERS